MYESPISITERIAHEIANEKDNQIFKAIAQVVVDVDKDEIIKALNYDRGQYEKGYRDGLEAAVIHAHWTPFWRNEECSNCGYEARWGTNYCPGCGAKMDEEVNR